MPGVVWGALYMLVCLRLCVSVVNSAIETRNEPDNEYLSISERPAWELLEKLRAITPDFAYYAFRDACGFPPCPRGAAARTWILENPDKIEPVVEAELTGRQKIILDVGVGSTDLHVLEGVYDV